MPDSLGLVVAALSYIAVVAVGVYAAYWAFAIRRRLIGHIHRNHALWLGGLGIGTVLTIPTSFVPSSNNPFINVLAAFYTNATWQILIAFAFIDSTIPVLRRSDPLLRSILHWKKVRIGLWSFLTFETILTIYMSIYFPACLLAATGDFSSCIRSSFAMSSPGWLGTILGFFGSDWLDYMMFCLVLGGAALLIGGRRSRDRVLRESVKWLGVGLVCVGVGFVFVIAITAILNLSNYYTTYSYGAVPFNVVLFLTCYAIYRSARSLAPLNRLPPIEPEISSSAKEATG